MKKYLDLADKSEYYYLKDNAIVTKLPEIGYMEELHDEDWYEKSYIWFYGEWLGSEEANVESNLKTMAMRIRDLLKESNHAQEAYDEKYEELTVKIQKSKDSIELLQNNVSNQKDVGKRMASLKKALADGDILDEFDRVVFESIVEKVIVGETNEDGTVDPYKLTFVMKGNGNSVVPNAKEWFKAEKSAIQPA